MLRLEVRGIRFDHGSVLWRTTESSRQSSGGSCATAGEVQFRSATMTKEDIANATVSPESSVIRPFVVAKRLPRWTTVPAARSVRPSGRTGRTKWTVRSNGEQTECAGITAPVAPVMTTSSNSASMPP